MHTIHVTELRGCMHKAESVEGYLSYSPILKYLAIAGPHTETKPSGR